MYVLRQRVYCLKVWHWRRCLMLIISKTYIAFIKETFVYWSMSWKILYKLLLVGFGLTANEDRSFSLLLSLFQDRIKRLEPILWFCGCRDRIHQTKQSINNVEAVSLEGCTMQSRRQSNATCITVNSMFLTCRLCYKLSNSCGKKLHKCECFEAN